MKNFKIFFKDFNIHIRGNKGKTNILNVDNFFKIKYKDIFKCISIKSTEKYK